MIFIESIAAWLSRLSINTVIMMGMMVFMLVGAVDRMAGNRHGYGEKFEEGFRAIGPLALSMVGIAAAAPILAKLLGPVISPLYSLLGADPAMFATTLLACDMGGYSLAMELADNPSVGSFAGLILGTMLGPTIVFTIPVALGILEKKDVPYLGAGIMIGLITIPLGCIAGGLAMNQLTDYAIPLPQIILNLVPVMMISGLLSMGLWFWPEKMVSGFHVFGRCITVTITLLAAIAVFEQITGILLPLFDVMAIPDESGLTPLDAGLLTCGQIGIVLIGAFPMVEWLTRTFGGAFTRIGRRLDLNDKACVGLVSSLAHVIAALSLVKEMNPKGKLLNLAFAVSAASMLGAHLGFTAGVDQSMVMPVIIGKLAASASALLLANWMAPSLLRKMNGAEENRPGRVIQT